MSADDCIMDVIGKNNSEHFFVATQQADLRKRILKVIVSLCCFVYIAVIVVVYFSLLHTGSGLLLTLKITFSSCNPVLMDFTHH